MSETYIQIQTTCSSEEEAKNLAAIVVDRRLAACVQVTGPVTSTYRWENQLETSQEWLCLIKTTNERFPAVRDTILDVHSYDMPQIISLPIIDGSDAYLEWIEDQTR
ncbi:MAG: divalent-cation tolerance protein CutA [Planctomycetaceae bacterium]|jgi:periplasmic divalent cation tolerance protein|nr:divalent-cation tolerance protein CutA [Planctomycetaceae bacterium]